MFFSILLSFDLPLLGYYPYDVPIKSLYNLRYNPFTWSLQFLTVDKV